MRRRLCNVLYLCVQGLGAGRVLRCGFSMRRAGEQILPTVGLAAARPCVSDIWCSTREAVEESRALSPRPVDAGLLERSSKVVDVLSLDCEALAWGRASY
jgi:hypothetical protein